MEAEELIFDVLTLKYGSPRCGKLEIEIGNDQIRSRAGEEKNSDGISGDTRELSCISAVVPVRASGLWSV